MEADDRSNKKRKRLSRPTVSSSSNTDLSRDETDASIQSGSSESESNQEQFLAEKSTPRVRSDGKNYVQKGSLTEAKLIEAKMKARSAKSKGEMTEDERRAERRAANRLSAFQSRQRRKIIIEDLQERVSQMSKHSSQLTRENSQFKIKIENVCMENELLRRQLAVATGLSATVTSNPNAPIHSSGLGALHAAGLTSQHQLSSMLEQNQRLRSLVARNPQPFPTGTLLTDLAIEQQLQLLQQQQQQQQQQPRQQPRQQEQSQPQQEQLQREQQQQQERAVLPGAASSSSEASAFALAVAHSTSDIAQLQQQLALIRQYQRYSNSSNNEENKQS